jgi:ATP-dependent RNA helicase RhlE
MTEDQHPHTEPVPTLSGAQAEAAAAPESRPVVSWESLNLSPESLELIHKEGYKHPSPVQAETIPLALAGSDVIASAQTGTGKTASFVLPMVEAFAGRQGTFGLILAPTREIAQQIEATIQLFGGPRGVRSAVLIGGIDMRHDIKALAEYPQIIVATPGRLCDHLDRGNIWLDYIEIVVLDEADRMLDMGFADQLSRITEDLPKQRQTMLFSATITPTVRRLAERILYQPKAVTIGKPLTAAKTVEQKLLWMREESKNRELQRQLRRESGSIIVFTRSKDGATRVWRSLHSAGFYDATFIHSDRLQRDREQALADFKEGKYRIMIATDVAARGLHIEGVSLVINYDLPMEAEDYVHRIGRTGRAGATGRSVTFCTNRDRGIVREIEKIVGREIPADHADGYQQPGEGGDRDPDRGGRGGRGGDRGRRGHGGGGGRGGDRPRGGERPQGVGPQALASGPDVGDDHAHQHSGARNPRGHQGGSRDGSREHAAVQGAQGAPTDPNDPSKPPHKRRRRRRGGRNRNKGGPGGAPEGSGGGGGGSPAPQG